MAVYYSKPVLKSLAQGDRLAFIRQFRHVSQPELGEKIGIRGDRARNQICRIERTSRNLRPERLEKIAEVLNINVAMLRRWDFENAEDLFYQSLWVEELCPDFQFRYSIAGRAMNPTHALFKDKYRIWKEMRHKYIRGTITYEEYWEWKLTKA